MKTASCTLRDVKSVRDTIRFYEDKILNYVEGRMSNASIESLNSKIKCFRVQVKRVLDTLFFMYCLATVLVLHLHGFPYRVCRVHQNHKLMLNQI